MRILFYSLLVIIGSFIVYMIWPNDEQLPAMKSTEPFSAELPTGDTYHSSNEKVKIVAFFYTNCPDICPLTFMDLMQVQSHLIENDTFGKEVEIVTITLDPEYDTQEVLLSYAKGFGIDSSGWKVLRTNLEKTKNIANDYQMTFRKDGNFVAHRTTMFLVDSKHNIRATYSMANPEEKVDVSKILDDIDSLINNQ